MALLTGLFKGKDDPIKTYDDFWVWFVRNEKKFFKVIKNEDDIEVNFFDKLAPKLAELKDGFWYLTGMFDENTVELILTADGEIKNIVFVEELVAAAPFIPGWKFTALKPSLNIENVSIKMDDYVSDSDTLTFYPNDDPKYPDEIEIVIVHSDFTEKNKSSIVSGVYLFLDNYLGELNSVTTIDSVLIIGKEDAQGEVMPIEKLKSYLKWREKEFVEKYHGVIMNTNDMQHSILEATTKEGSRLIAAINTEILNWDRKASHPWVLSIDVSYDGSNNGGLPEEETNQALWKLEERIAEQLTNDEGHILVGHESVDNLRSIYFACKDFRKPSKVLHKMSLEPEWKIDYKIYKDKYWRSLSRFDPTNSI